MDGGIMQEVRRLSKLNNQPQKIFYKEQLPGFGRTFKELLEFNMLHQ
jgi:hypothetical protein